MVVKKWMITITGEVSLIKKAPKISYVWIICKNRKGGEIKFNCKVFNKDIKLLDKIQENKTYTFVGDIQFNSEQTFTNKKGYEIWNKDIVLYNLLKNVKDNPKKITKDNPKKITKDNPKKITKDNPKKVQDWLDQVKEEESEPKEKVIKKEKKGNKSAKEFAENL